VFFGKHPHPGFFVSVSVNKLTLNKRSVPIKLGADFADDFTVIAVAVQVVSVALPHTIRTSRRAVTRA
jgi:hypothetical protein